MSYLISPLKWAGSKNKVLDKLLPVLEKYRTKTFCEPFVGAANVCLNFEADNYILNDLNYDLINTYNWILREYHEYLEGCADLFNRGFDNYYQLRELFNNELPDSLNRACLFQYLNKHGFNGLCRYNKSGQFNVPIGTSSKPKNVPIQQVFDFHDRFSEKAIQLSAVNFQRMFNSINRQEDVLVYCFDKDTELLTKSGWKFVKDITTEDYCLSRESSTNLLDWVDVTETHNRVYDGEMYKYQGKSLDVFVTKDHNLLLNNPHSGKNTKSKAFETIGKKLRWVCGGGLWERETKPCIDVCGFNMPKQSFAYILGIFVTDGCVNNKGSITISQTKENILLKIKDHLKKCDIEFSEYKNKGNKTIYITRKLLPFFQQFYLKNERSIPREFLDADKQTLFALLEGIIDGDGDNAKDREHIRISLGSKPLVDNIMEIAIKLGKSSTFSIRQPKESYLKSDDRIIRGKSIYYVVSINETKYRTKRKTNESLVNYNGPVYCVTLSQWNNVLMRRNGKTCWIGQCDPPYVPLTSDFNYTADGFGYDQQVQLKELSKSSKHTCIISNHWTPVTEQLYSDADDIIVFDVQRTISCKGSDRKKVQECIVIYEGKV